MYVVLLSFNQLYSFTYRVNIMVWNRYRYCSQTVICTYNVVTLEFIVSLCFVIL